MRLDQDRLLSALKEAYSELGRSRGDITSLNDPALRMDVIERVISGVVSNTRSKGITRQHQEPEIIMEFIVARVGRTGLPKSVKLSNVTREISRTVYVPALVGVASLTVGGLPGALAALIGLSYAVYNATSAAVGYSDACVLHKAWKLARQDNRDFITLAELLTAKTEIAAEYTAPKCVGDTEILDAIENLKGLKAMVEVEGKLYLKEKIVFFANGEIKN